jgi:Zn-dependent protease/CBS domain-containing protein
MASAPSTRMDTSSHRSSISLFQVRGIHINIDYSWFIIFFLILLSLSVGYFPFQYPDQSPWVYAAMGLMATLLFFASILIHEFSHAMMARRCGIHIPAITLFIFGGMAHMGAEAKTPKVEFKIAIVGPLMSLALAGMFYLGWKMLGQQATPLTMIFQYLAWINLALAIFNLVPAYPLDGGRVFRAWWWWKTNSLERATRLASNFGKGFAYSLMFLGAVQIFGGMLIGGIWLILIGMFLRGIAEGGYQEVIMRQSLEGVSAQEIMVTKPVSIPSELSISQALTEYFLKYGYSGFPVTKDNRIVGMLTMSDLHVVSEEERTTTTVENLMSPLNSKWTIEPETSLSEAIKYMAKEGINRVLVMRNNELLGLVTQKQIFRYAELKHLLASPSR